MFVGRQGEAGEEAWSQRRITGHNSLAGGVGGGRGSKGREGVKEGGGSGGEVCKEQQGERKCVCTFRNSLHIRCARFG